MCCVVGSIWINSDGTGITAVTGISNITDITYITYITGIANIANIAGITCVACISAIIDRRGRDDLLKSDIIQTSSQKDHIRVHRRNRIETNLCGISIGNKTIRCVTKIQIVEGCVIEHWLVVDQQDNEGGCYLLLVVDTEV